MSLCPDMRGFSWVVSHQFIMSTRGRAPRGTMPLQCPIIRPAACHRARHPPPTSRTVAQNVNNIHNKFVLSYLLWMEVDLDPLHAPFQCQHKINCILYFAAFPPRPARVSADHNISSHLRGRGLHDKTGEQRTVTQVNNWSYCIFQIYRQFYWPWEMQKVGWLGNNDRVVALILWSSGKGQARIGKGWPLRWKALTLEPLPRAYTKVGCHLPTTHPPTRTFNFT